MRGLVVKVLIQSAKRSNHLRVKFTLYQKFASLLSILKQKKEIYFVSQKQQKKKDKFTTDFKEILQNICLVSDRIRITVVRAQRY